MGEALLTIATVVLTAAFYYWLGWDNRGDVEETRRWDAGCRCDLDGDDR